MLDFIMEHVIESQDSDVEEIAVAKAIVNVGFLEPSPRKEKKNLTSLLAQAT